MKLDYTSIGITVVATLVAVYAVNHFGNNLLVKRNAAGKID